MQKIKGKTLIGITGGIGCGKTLVCHELAKSGYKVFYADPIAKQLYSKDKKLVQKIVKIFGKDILNFRGKLNLSKLRTLIFANEKNYRAMNKIVHPVVIDYIRKQAAKAKQKTILIESALVFESDLHKILDFAITVYSNKKNRLERIMLRDGAKKKEIEQIMKYQLDERIKVEKSDFVIINNKSLDVLYENILFLSKILKLIV